MRRSIKKSFLALLLCILVGFFCVPAEAQNLLQNNSFEDSGWPPVSWSEWSGAVDPYSGTYGYVAYRMANSGVRSAVRGLYGTGVRWAGFSQDVAVSEGAVVNASGWFLSPTGNPLRNGSEAYIEIKFLDAGESELAIHQSATLTGASLWTERMITNVQAPVGTAVARFSFVLSAPNDTSSGVVYFDDGSLEFDITAPIVTITSPADELTTNSSPVLVSGTVNDITITSIDVNGNIEPVSGGSWSSNVSLVEGSNIITATATDAGGNPGSNSITVYLITSAPVVVITSPADESTTEDSPITVSGTVDDLAITLIDVSGAIETVSSGSWSSAVSLVEGANLITATATDGAGNPGSDSITVYFNPQNELQNPGFEDSGWPPVNWSEWGGAASGDPADGSYGYIDTVEVHSGSQSAARGLYGNGIRWGGYTQDVTIGGWDFIRASCWLMSSSSDDPLANGAEAYIEVKFLDGSDGEIGYYRSTPLDDASAWVEHTIQRCAPKNAAKVRFSLVLIGQEENSSGKVYFDDASIEVIPGSCAPEVETPFEKPMSTGSVQISGNALLVEGRSFTIKGVCYQPVPIGEVPWGYDIYNGSHIYDRDMPILRDMGANTIRTYNKVTSTVFLDACYNGGVDPIYVVMGFYIEGSSDLGDPAVRSAIKIDFQNYVSTYKNHPAVLMWSPGNETEYAYTGCGYEYYTLLNELAEIAYQEEGSAYHPVTAALAYISDIGDTDLLTADEDMDYLDVWGANVYTGLSFGPLFDDYAGKSSKVFWVSEFGVDAWHTNDKYGDPADGYLDETSQEQYDAALWDEIESRNDVCSGGTVFEYSDEWWKDGSADPALHEYYGFAYGNINHPDQYSNEEWYGIAAVLDNGMGPDVISLRNAYYALQSRWVEIDDPAIHIEDISMELAYWYWLARAKAIITIYDDAGQPVSGATVSGTWSNLTFDSDSGVTDAEGKLTVESNNVIVNPGAEFIFTITNVVKDGCVYDAIANAEKSDSIIIP